MNIYKQGIFFLIPFLLFISCSQKTSLQWIPFSWEGDTISGKYIEKAFMFIPVKIEDLPYDFTMQLDLGMEQTVFYGNTIDSNPEISISLADKYEIPFFKNVSLRMGDVEFHGIDVGYYNNFGEEISGDSIHLKFPIHIGTIGTDVFRNKILIIDYKSGVFAVTENLPDEYKSLPAEKFEESDGIIKLPFDINGEKQLLMFDTGSSSFQLVTTEKRALEIADSFIVDSLSGPLWWGREITLYGLEVNKPIKFSGRIREKSRVYYVGDGLWDGIFDSLEVWGLTGNAYFFDNMVIIDYKNKLFRVK